MDLVRIGFLCGHFDAHRCTDHVILKHLETEKTLLKKCEI
jgi:hypothetical protein